MSIVTRAAKNSPRLFAALLFIALVSTFAFASRWESLRAFGFDFGEKVQAESTGGRKNSALVKEFGTGEAFLTPGTCDTAGPIEVEGTIAGTTPTAYATLGAAFAAINAGTHTGAITIDVCGDTTETAIAAINASGSGSASYTSITVSPAGGAARTITGNLASSLIDFNGADNVTINGLNTGGNSLTISNTNTSTTSGTSTLRFLGDAIGNTVTNSTILGSSQASYTSNGGTIYFAAGAVTNGNDNNIISNNNIGPATATLPIKAIYSNGTTTSTTTYNSGIQITGNNIYDFFTAAAQSGGIQIGGGSIDWTVSNNKFYQTATRTQTTGAVHAAIHIASSNVNNCTISGNTVGYSSNTGTGTYAFVGVSSSSRFYPIYLSTHGTTTATNITNNIITAISVTGAVSGTGTSAPFIGILYASPGSASFSPNITGNTIGSNSTVGAISFSSTASGATSDVMGIYYFPSSPVNLSNNTVGGVNATNTNVTPGAVDLYGLRANTTSTATNTINNNTVGFSAAPLNNTSTNTGSNTYGIYSQAGTAVATGNVISNLSMNAPNTGTGSTASMIGLWIDNTSATAGNNVAQNSVSLLSNTDTAAAVSVTGLHYNGSTTGTHVVQRNYIHSLSTASASATAIVNGINIQAGAATYRNNMIAVGSNMTANSPQINGINETTAGTDNFYHNSVYIGGSGVSAGTANSFAFQSSITTNARNYRDNIFFNARSNGAATGKHYAIRVGGTTANPTGLTSNNNILFVSGTGGFVGLFNAIDQATLSNWQTATGNDAASFSANPQFNDPTNTTPDLHLHPTNPTVAEGNGTDVGVIDDFDGQTRASLTPVDIGADAGNFNGIDLAAPNISYTPFTNTSSTTNRTLAVTMTDATGVATGGLAPRVYFNKNAGMYSSTACSLSSGTVQNGVWDCTIDYSLVGGVVATDVIRYFVVAQDTLGNLRANPSAGFTGTDVNTVTTPPTTPNQYLISTAFNGSISVGTGETITSLTNSGGLFEQLNAGVLTGNLVVNLTSDLTAETGAVALNQLAEDGVGGYTIQFQASGGARLISGSSTTALINLNGADRVTFSGLAHGPLGLTIRNTSATTGAVVQMTNDASSNSILSCAIEGGNTNTSSALVLIGTGTTTGNDNNAVTGSTVRDRTDAAGVPANLIASLNASTTARNSGNTISDNTLINFTANGIATSSGATSEDWSIANNDISQTATRTTAVVGINTGGMQGTNTVSGNKIHGFISSGFSNIIGMLIGNSRNLTISRNRVYDFQTTAGATGVITGIEFDGSSGNTPSVTIINNMISLAPTIATAQAITGIFDFGFSGNVFTADYNSIYIGGTASGAASSWALRRGISAPTTFTARNNIAFNNRTGGTGNHFAGGDQSANTGTFVSNYNFYAGTGATAANFMDYGTASTGVAVSFAAWQTGPPARDANSIANVAATYNPADYFIDAATGDLHLKPTATAVIDAGLALGTVTTDFDGDTRPQGTAPEIGADEFIPAMPGTVQFNSATYSVTEGTPNVTLTVTRTGGSSGAVTVNYALAGSGANPATGTAACGTPGQDFVNTGGSVMFADGDAADKTFNVPVCNDTVYELAQTFDATLSIGSGAATLGTPNPATVTINNDDAAPTVGINDVSQAEGNSGASNFGFGIVVTGASEASAGFVVQTADGTATQPSDYSSVNTSIAVPSDVARTTTTYPGLVVAVNGDTMFEANETFFMNASGCTDCTIADNQGVGTIQNDDAQPSVQFSSATYSNSDDIAKFGGNEDEIAPQVATITVTRTGATGDAFSVNYATVAGGTATAGGACGTGSGVDYVSTSGTLAFAAGETSKTFNITVCTDNLFEGNETVNLALTAPTPPVILGTPATAVLTIEDNDSVPTLQFSSATYSNSDDIAKFGVTTEEFAPSVATITVTRTGAVDNPVTVNYATSNGTATGGASCTPGVDYISTSGTLNFAAGVISQTFNVTVCTDALFEGNETVNLTLTNPSAPAALGTPNSAVLTIIDNEVQPSLQFSAASYGVSEGAGSATITVTRTGATENSVSVNYQTVAGGTATGGASCGGAVDYQNTSGTLSFAAGETSKTFGVPLCDDATAESTETVNLALSAPSGGAVLGAQSTAVLNILDNDAAPTLQFSSATYSASESAGTITLTVTRSGATGNALTVDYGTGGGTATAGACAPGVDYNTASGTLNFASGETSKTFNVTICNDSVYELNQTFNATLTNPTGGATLGTPNPATVTINNDDDAPTVAINDITQAEGNAGTTVFQFVVSLTGATELATEVDFATADGTATTPGDYGSGGVHLTFTPPGTALGVNIAVVGDTTVEPDETFFGNLTNCVNCTIADNQGVATIQNDDATLQFSSATYTVGEGGGSATITVTRTGATNGAASVGYSTVGGGTALGGGACGPPVDYVNTFGTLNFGLGETSKTFSVPICEDALVESNETINLQLSSPTGATLGTPGSAVLTITDNDSDSTPPTISYTPLTNVAIVQDRTFTVTATDNVGVTGVTVVWRNNGGAGGFINNPCSLTGGTAQNGTWTCTIISGVGPQTNPGTVSYFVSANDAAANSATNPSTATVNGGTWNLYTIGSGGTIDVSLINSFENLIVGSGFTLNGNATVTGNLTLSGGVFNTGANTLTLECNATVTGGGEFAYVIGNLEKRFCGLATFTFNVGAAFALPPVTEENTPAAPEGIASNYSPLTVQITGGTVGSSLTVSATDAFMTGAVEVNSISRFWTLTENGNLTANLTFTYRNEDVVGVESSYNVLRRAGGMTSTFPGGSVNAATNMFSAPNVSDFSQWSAGVAVPTAASAEISGRLVTASGEGIRNATVMLTGGDLTHPVYVQTGTFGAYRFGDLAVGQIYVVTVISKRYTFAEPSRVINLSDSVTDQNFVANEQ